MAQTHVIDRHLPVAGIVARVRAAAGGGAEKMRRVYDCASWTFEVCVALLALDAPSSVFLALHPVEEEGEKGSKEETDV